MRSNLTASGALFLFIAVASCADDESRTAGTEGQATTGQPMAETDGDDSQSVGGEDRCDPRTNAGCGPGTKCTFISEAEDHLGVSRNDCATLWGTAGAGDRCQRLPAAAGADTCDRGLYCVVEDRDARSGTCMAFCGPADTCELSTARCVVSHDGDLPLCLQTCDPIVPDCPPNWRCQPSTFDSWACRPPLLEGGGEWGFPCDPESDCDPEFSDTCVSGGGCGPGLLCWSAFVIDNPECADSGSAGCCAQICDLDSPELVCPGPLEQCLPLFEQRDAAPPDLGNVGLCAVPQLP